MAPAIDNQFGWWLETETFSQNGKGIFLCHFFLIFNMFEMHRYKTKLSESNTLAEATECYNFEA